MNCFHFINDLLFKIPSYIIKIFFKQAGLQKRYDCFEDEKQRL